MGGIAPPHSPPGDPPQAPRCFGLNPPSQLVIWYHWLAFLKQVRNNLPILSSSQFTTNVEHKIDHISKTKYRKIVKFSAKSVDIFFQTILRTLNDYISKTENRKNRKIDFSFVSEHCAKFRTKKESALFEGGKGVCMSSCMSA